MIHEANAEMGRREKLTFDLLTFARPKKFNFELVEVQYHKHLGPPEETGKRYKILI